MKDEECMRFYCLKEVRVFFFILINLFQQSCATSENLQLVEGRQCLVKVEYLGKLFSASIFRHCTDPTTVL
jgi:hypothetical protein